MKSPSSVRMGTDGGPRGSTTWWGPRRSESGTKSPGLPGPPCPDQQATTLRHQRCRVILCLSKPPRAVRAPPCWDIPASPPVPTAPRATMSPGSRFLVMPLTHPPTSPGRPQKCASTCFPAPKGPSLLTAGSTASCLNPDSTFTSIACNWQACSRRTQNRTEVRPLRVGASQGPVHGF